MSDTDEPVLELGKKKKRSKKKKVVFEEKVDVDFDDEALSFIASLSNKKKKKKKEKVICDEINEVDNDDYTYDELLGRLYGNLRVWHSKLKGAIKKNSIIPARIAREGAKKTSFFNFQEVCASLNRDPNHVSTFILSELSTTGSVDGQDQLSIKGKFGQNTIDSVMRNYTNEYIMCKMCRGMNTQFIRDPHNRLTRLKCNQCEADRTVDAINIGFSAQVGRRKKHN